MHWFILVSLYSFFLTPFFLDAPFSVHRAGKGLGTDVGQWFGPSVAAGGIRSVCFLNSFIKIRRTLVSQFPECGLTVAVAADSTLYSQVLTFTHGESSSNTNYRSPRRHYVRTWGDRPVLLLLGMRLGIEGVNPISYDTIKVYLSSLFHFQSLSHLQRLYEFQQSVTIEIEVPRLVSLSLLYDHRPTAERLPRGEFGMGSALCVSFFVCF